jgi:hypothetical protein
MGQHEDLRRGRVLEACGRPDAILAMFGVDESDLATGGLP